MHTAFPMNFDEFEHLARLYVINALEQSELAQFEAARQQFGARAETFIAECRKLDSAFALSLQPQPPSADAKRRLIDLVERSLKKRRSGEN